MIIPMRCMNCGFVLADKWRWYEREVARLKKERGLSTNPVYIDGTSAPKTPEHEVLTTLGIKRYCCRKHLLTHRDLIENI